MSSSRISWILVGAPNSGKTSLFNQLTKSRKEVMNYPGSTVKAFHATTHIEETDVQIVDTPGVYDLDKNSLEVQEFLNTLAANPNAILIYVVDARFFNHRIKLMQDIMKLNHSCIVYCTHIQQANLDLNTLNQTYNIPFIGDNSSLSLKTLIYAATHLQHPDKQLTQKTRQKNLTPVLDSIFLNPYFGPWIALLLLALSINLVFSLAHPLSVYIESVMDQILVWLTPYNHNLSSLLSGAVLGLGSLLMFTPQIFLLFFLIFLTQESGYLARAAAIFDPFLRYFGISGRSVVSVLSGFSCAVPAILLTKTLESRRERVLAMIAIPFLVCSARIPMLTMCVSFLFYEESGLISGIVFTLCFFASLLLGLLAAAFLSYILPPEPESSFMLELPPYQRPKLRQTALLALRRVVSFIKEAGPLIFTASFLIWLTSSLPFTKEGKASNIEDSYIATVAKVANPVFEPMGTDWRVGTALLASFAAREVFVPSVTMLMNKDLPESTGNSVFATFQHVKKPNGDKLFSIASVVALLVFFMLALQCSSTTTLIAKETKSWKFAISQFMIMNIFAYILAVCTYQLLKGIT